MPKNETVLSSLSVFFPCFNEEKNIALFVKQAEEILPKIADKYEILIVNDGSRDQTKAVAEKVASSNTHIKVINHDTNRGYGAALKSGFSASSHDWIFFTDGDLQFDLTELQTLLPFTKTNSVIIGYRKNRAEGFRRALNARLFKTFVDILFRLHVRDIDCAFKLIRRDALQNIGLVSDGAFISSELLYRLKKKGYKFKQIGVTHYSRQFGNPTGSNLRVILKALKETVTLYLYMKFGLFSGHYTAGVKHKGVTVS
jgi:glycosyltransferase involved in cell wall biosynthesis